MQLDQSVITAARTDRPLGTQLLGYPFKYGFAIIIEASNQTWIDLIFKFGSLIYMSLVSRELQTILILKIDQPPI